VPESYAPATLHSTAFPANISFVFSVEARSKKLDAVSTSQAKLT